MTPGPNDPCWQEEIDREEAEKALQKIAENAPRTPDSLHTWCWTDGDETVIAAADEVAVFIADLEDYIKEVTANTSDEWEEEVRNFFNDTFIAAEHLAEEVAYHREEKGVA